MSTAFSMARLCSFENAGLVGLLLEQSLRVNDEKQWNYF